jgi:hypothetical protein
MPRLTKAQVLWLAAYLLCVTAIVWSLQVARRRVLDAGRTNLARQNWQAWKDEVARQQSQENVPVRRQVPQSEEPPATLLLRDHYAVVLTACVVVGSFLFWFVAFIVRGVVTTRPRIDLTDAPPRLP